GLGEGFGVLVGRQVDVGDLAAGGLADLGGEVGVRPGDVAGELVDLALVTLAGQRRDRGGGVVGPGGAGDAAVTGAAHEAAGLGGLLDRVGVVLVVPVVAQDRGGQAGGLDEFLGRLVLRG